MIGVSIVSYNTRELLKNCLKELENQKCSQRIEIWVLDNNSSDGSAQMVSKEFPKVHLIQEKTNEGFAKGHNKILKEIHADFVLVLNPDTQIPDTALEKAYVFMKDHPNCGISSCKIVGFDGSLHSNGGNFPVGLSLVNWLFNLEVLGLKKNFHREEKGYYEKSREVDWVGGTFMMVRPEVFAKIGYFNEDYFMYFEDAELCFLAQKAGYSVMLNSDLTIKHVSGASSIDPRLRQWRGEFKGLILFSKKQFGYSYGIFVTILVYIAVVARILAFALVGKLNFSKTYAKILFSL